MELPPSPEVQYIVCISCCTSHCLRTQNPLQDLDLSQETAKNQVKWMQHRIHFINGFTITFLEVYITFYGRTIIENKFK